MPADADRLLGVLLAGGAGRRMGGGDKCLRPLAGRPLLRHVIDRLAPQVDAMMVSANGDPARFASFGLPVIADRPPPAGAAAEPLQGPLAGVLAALDWAAEQVPAWPMIVTVPTDAPFLPRDLVIGLCSALVGTGADLACARTAGRRHPVVGLWPTRLREDLRAALAAGVRKVDDWTARHHLTEADFPLDGNGIDPFFNINRPEDLAAAEDLLSQA